MILSKFHILLIALAILLVLLNALASREIYHWTASVKKQIALHCLVWLLPVIGLYCANKLGKFDWFTKDKHSGDSSVIAGGFMEADAVFNPRMKHRIEMVEKQKVESRQEYCQTDRDRSPDKRM